MDDVVVRLTLSLIGPGVMLVFGLAFGGAFLIERRRPYLLLLAAACLFFALGAITQILRWPSDTGVNSMASGALYTTAVLLAAQAILMRSNREVGWGVAIAAFATITILLWYFFYVDRSLLARVYVQNFGYGLILLASALRLTALARGRYIDRILFWILLLFALQFFPRTILTIGSSAPPGAEFANSLFWQALQLTLAVQGAALAMAILGAAFSDLLDDTRRERDFDVLTNVLNRRGFEDRAQTALRRAAEPASLILCDVDHFKRINDRYGHVAGDRILKEVGGILRSMSRKHDLVGRVGGEEFAVFLPATNQEEALDIAERLRLAIKRHPFAHEQPIQVTASFGVAQHNPAESWGRLYKRADDRLYAAKQAGRNRAVGTGEPARGDGGVTQASGRPEVKLPHTSAG